MECSNCHVVHIFSWWCIYSPQTFISLSAVVKWRHSLFSFCDMLFCKNIRQDWYSSLILFISTSRGAAMRIRNQIDNTEFLVANGKEETSETTMTNWEKYMNKERLSGLTFVRFIFSQELFIFIGFINCDKVSAHSHLYHHPEWYHFDRKKNVERKNIEYY